MVQVLKQFITGDGLRNICNFIQHILIILCQVTDIHEDKLKDSEFKNPMMTGKDIFK
jgi:hypothetical protein